MSQALTTESRAELVLAILRGDITVAAAAQRHGLPEDEIACWRDTFLLAASSEIAHRRALERARRQGGSRTRRVRRVAMAVAAALIFALGAAAYAATGDCTQSKLPFCFTPNNPARAVEVNHNFNQLVEWIETKVGDVNDANVTIGGTLTLGSNAGTVLKLYDDADIAGVDHIQGYNDLRLGATAGEVDLAIDGSGDTRVYQDLHVDGSYNGFSVESYNVPGASEVSGTCPPGKRIAWAMGWVNDYNTDCSANIFNSNKNLFRCAKETVRTGCIGKSSCTYTGTGNGCGDPGHTCLYLLCI